MVPVRTVSARLSFASHKQLCTMDSVLRRFMMVTGDSLNRDGYVAAFAASQLQIFDLWRWEVMPGGK